MRPGLRADDWPQWLGPQRDSVWRETGIVSSFPAGGPPVVWRAAIGSGYSGPAVAQGRVYVLDHQLAKASDKPTNAVRSAHIPGAERILCLNADDGKVLWRHEYDCPYTVSLPGRSAHHARGQRGKGLLARGGRQFVLPGRGDRKHRVVAGFQGGLQNQDPDVGLRGKPAAGRQQTDLPGRRLQLDGGRFGQKHRPGNLAGVERQGAGILFPGDLSGGRRQATDRLASRNRSTRWIRRRARFIGPSSRRSLFAPA